LFNIWFLTDRVNKTPAGRFKTSSRPAQVKLKTGARPAQARSWTVQDRTTRSLHRTRAFLLLTTMPYIRYFSLVRLHQAQNYLSRGLPWQIRMSLRQITAS